ncbi:redoxin domain-containing protein [Mucilaginibacter sp. dw_454]|uniref:redoxin domain-containing protein n=1 Tax=Mucilaginibacter sp. dw_454 TaxID=2720079 RepID=UPI001BD5757B|nr:redoxin domain-containing protein [Mucilaginibacter sp. dw_454]
MPLTIVLTQKLSAQDNNYISVLARELRNTKITAFQNVENYPEHTIKLSDLDGKTAILLDFGGINCRGCVAGLPVLDSLQKKLKNKLLIIWVTQNSKEQISEFLTNNKIGKKLSIPIMANDTDLYNYFLGKSRQIPQEVMIDCYGNTIGLVGGQVVSGPLLNFLANVRMGTGHYVELWKDPR